MIERFFTLHELSREIGVPDTHLSKLLKNSLIAPDGELAGRRPLFGARSLPIIRNVLAQHPNRTARMAMQATNPDQVHA